MSIYYVNSYILAHKISFMRSLLLMCLLAIVSISCENSTSSQRADLKGYNTENIGGGTTYAEFLSQSNWPLSTGHTVNGAKNGSWMTYHDNSNRIKTISSYANGSKNGPEVTLNERGTTESVKHYRNDVLHGLSIVYKNTRTLSETSYKNGKLDGPFSIFDEVSGKIQRSGAFKNGLQDGELLYYDDQGNITLRYEYKDGQKVGGGIVDNTNQ